MPRRRPDPFSQVADGGRFHLVPGLQILEQDRAQLDEPQCRLASGDYGVHARAIAVVWADATVAVAVQRRGVAARTAVTLTGDEIDDRCFISLLHGLPLSVAGQGPNGALSAVSFWPKAQERGFWHSIRGQTPPAKRGDQLRGPGDSRDLRTPCVGAARGPAGACQSGPAAAVSHDRGDGLVGTDSRWRERTARVLAADPRSVQGPNQRTHGVRCDSARPDPMATIPETRFGPSLPRCSRP